MNSGTRFLQNFGPRTVQLIQRRHRLILDRGYKDGFKEIPNTGFAPKHAKAYADITTPQPKHFGIQEYNDNLFTLLCVGLTLGFAYVFAVRPIFRSMNHIHSHQLLIQADERYAEYLEKYYYDELKKVMDDEAIMAVSSK